MQRTEPEIDPRWDEMPSTKRFMEIIGSQPIPLNLYIQTCILCRMVIQWDETKNEVNFAERGIWFADAEPVLFDPNSWTVEHIDTQGEERFQMIGMDALGRLLIVVYTYRDEGVRLISARRANTRERQGYGKRL